MINPFFFMGVVNIIKKTFLVLLVVVLIILGDTVFQIATASVPPFNHDVFTNFKGYAHSMFMSDEWVYGGMWIKRFADWNLVLYLGVQGKKGSTYGPFLNVLAVDDGLNIKHRALQFSAKLDGKEYTFTLLHEGSIDCALLGYNGMEMVKSLSHAKDIAFHITYQDFELQLGQSQIGEIYELVAVSQELLSNNIWHYADCNMMELGDIQSKITDNAEFVNVDNGGYSL